MLPDLRTTVDSNELSFVDIVSGSYVIQIPLFQREYRWQKRNLELLLQDAQAVRDGEARAGFLGVLVVVDRGTTPGKPVYLEIVDGQQRLSSIYLQIMACVDVLAAHNELNAAAALISTYLLTGLFPEEPPQNTRLVPSVFDRAQFKAVWAEVTRHRALMELPILRANPPRPPAVDELQKRGPMFAQYKNMRAAAELQYADGQLQSLSDFVDTLANKLSFVWIRLADPSAAPKIFERLNDRAERVTTGDLGSVLN